MRKVRPLAMAAGAVVMVIAGARAPAAAVVDTGPAEPPITTTGVEGDYLRVMHRYIHFRWTSKFLEGVVHHRPAGDPVRNRALETEVLFAVRWDGSAAEVTVSKSSGVRDFDRGAIEAVRGEYPYPVPPLELYGDDGVAHFRWTLAADGRLCSDAEVRRREERLEVSLPRLFIQGRIKEALLRVARAMRGGDSGAMATFAHAWLARPFTDPAVDARAAAALARTGDQRQVARLRPALARPDSAVVAARALAALNVDLCAAVQPALQGTDPAATALAIQVLRAPGSELPATSPCLHALAGMLEDATRPPAQRATILEALAALTPGGARRTTLAALADTDPVMRAAGASAFGRPGGGRPSLYRLQPLLKDRAPEVRAAAAAATARAAGDIAFEYLQPLFKERELQPLLALAAELGHQRSAASADFLGRILKEATKRNSAALRLAATQALGERHDARAEALFQPLAAAIRKDARAPAELRTLALARADGDELMAMQRREPALGPLAFKALLRAKRHQEAAEWLVASFDRHTPDVLVDLFSAWLDSPPPRVADGAATTARGSP